MKKTLIKGLLISALGVFFLPQISFGAIISITDNGDTVLLTSDGNVSTIWCGSIDNFATSLGASANNPEVGDSAVFGAQYVPPLNAGTYYVREWKDGTGYAGCTVAGFSDSDSFYWDGSTIGTAPSTIDLVEPLPQTYLNNPVTWVSDYYMDGSCFKEITYDTQWLNASSSPIFQANQPSYLFNQCYSSGTSGTATSTYNLPFQGNWRTRARLTAFVTASSTDWTDWIYFGLGTTTIPIDSPTISFVPQDCDWLDIGCQLKNAMGWAFVPDQDSLNQYADLKDNLNLRFPFSYVSSVTDQWESLQASSTLNSPIYSINLYDLGVGSTTPMGNFLPNFTAFSSSTVTQYFPSGTFDLLKNLAGLAIILALIADIFFTVRNFMRTKP